MSVDLRGDDALRTVTFSKTKLHVVCPWHGFEFDIRTGQHPANPRARLRKMDVRVDGGDVVVTVPDTREAAPA